MYKNAIFDVDGTIFNTFSGVSKCIKKALKECGISEPSDETLRRFLGPAIIDSLTQILGLDVKTAESVVETYRKYYKTDGIFDCEMYAGYPQVFKKLKDAGVALSAASSKPKQYLLIIFEKFGIDKYFDKIEGPTMDAQGSDKSQILRLARLDENAIMIGDRKFDILAAKNIGVPSIGVTYGFCEEGEFEACKPDFVADTAEQVYDILMESKK